MNKIRRLVDHMAVILPFEADFYRQHQVPATFVGHPLLDADETAVVPVSAPPDEGRVVGLLPGSRNKEVRRHLPVMLKAARILAQKRPGLRFLVSAAPTVERRGLEEITATLGRGLDLSISNEIQDVFDRSFFLMAASGTVTLQAALTGTPWSSSTSCPISAPGWDGC